MNVITKASGGLPVVDVGTGKYGLPVYEASTGIAVTKVVNSGLPVTFVGTGIPAGYPDASTTGVQTGITLTPRGDWDINASGTYENMDVTGYVNINASNVTLRNCRITAKPGQISAVVYVFPSKTGVIIEYCDIDGAQVQGLKGVWVDTSNGTIVRFNDIRFCEDGVYVFGNNIEIRNNYIHDLVSAGSDPHHDNTQIGGAGTGIVLDHNTLIGAADANACLQFGNASGNVSVTINDNLMRPGPVMLCLLNCGDTSVGGFTCVWNVTNNRMEPGRLATGTPGQKCATWNVNRPTTWTGNVDADTLAPIAPP